MLRATARLVRGGSALARTPHCVVSRPCSSLAAYHELADVTLEGVQEAFEILGERELELGIECEVASGVLNVAVGDAGTFVLNKQAPNEQLWLSSPVTGPLRYDYCASTVAWLNTRDGHELLSRIADDFKEMTGEAIGFDRVADELREAAEDL